MGSISHNEEAQVFERQRGHSETARQPAAPSPEWLTLLQLEIGGIQFPLAFYQLTCLKIFQHECIFMSEFKIIARNSVIHHCVVQSYHLWSSCLKKKKKSASLWQHSCHETQKKTFYLSSCLLIFKRFCFIF